MVALKHLKRIIGAVFCIASGANALAQDTEFYCDDRELGGQFYCVDKTPEEKPIEAPQASAPSAEKKALEEFEAFKEKLETARAVAVYTGDAKDIEKYMRIQKEAAEMSSRFMQEYQFLGWQDPTLSYAAAVPVETFAKNAYRSERRQEVERHLKKARERYGFFYFYSKDCAACVTFSPVVKRLSARHSLSVIPIAKAGKESIEWPGTRADNGIGERVGLIGDVTPAIVLYDAKQEAGVPISYGAVSLETLENRIYMLTREEKVKFLGGETDVR